LISRSCLAAFSKLNFIKITLFRVILIGGEALVDPFLTSRVGFLKLMLGISLTNTLLKACVKFDTKSVKFDTSICNRWFDTKSVEI
jgi:hypothetical protein